MKTIRLCLFASAVFGVSLSLLAQQVSTPTPSGDVVQSLPQPTPYSVVTKDGNSQVWERTVYEQAPDGTVIPKKHSYTELATGLNHLVNGQWVESKEEIDILPDGTAAATNGQHQVYFPSDIYNGQIKMVTPDGKVLQSQPLGLSYDDGSNTVLIAVLTNSIGELISSNQVLYPNAFVGINADLRYTYTKAGFEQDVILRTQPPSPEDFNLNPQTAKLQLLTEFFNPPEPSITATPLPTQAGMALSDDNLDFGTMQMVQGKAFLLGQDAHDARAQVGKQWLNISGRQILIEQVPVMALADDLLQLPTGSAKATFSSPLHVVSAKRLLPEQHLAKAGKTTLITKALSPNKGLVLDYVTLNVSSQTNYTFQSDTTYYIGGIVTLKGTNTFEGGTVIKYAATYTITVSASAKLNWQATAYRPVVFTAKDDNSVGEAISGSTGAPTFYYAYGALTFSTNNLPILSHFRICYAMLGVAVGQPSGGVTNGAFYDAQFIQCRRAIDGGIGYACFHNVLFANIQTNFSDSSALPSSSICDVQNSTFANITTIAGAGSGSQTLNFTNCAFANVTNLYSSGATFTMGGAYNGFYNSPTVGTSQFTNTFYPFQTVGAGSYYLTNGCGFHTVGTTNIDPVLLADLLTKTTYPPIVYSNLTFSVATNFSPQAPRDTNTAPDLGYHYDPLDYIFGGVTASNNLIFAAGTAVGYWTNGITLGSSAKIYFNGMATLPCIFALFNTVQEGANGAWAHNGCGILGNTNQGLFATFTHFCTMNNNGVVFAGGGDYQYFQVQASHSEFYGNFNGENLEATFTNCLLQRAKYLAYSYSVGPCTGCPYAIFRNCTFRGGAFEIDHWEHYPYWYSSVRDCAFDGTSITYYDASGGALGYMDYNYNAYKSGATELPVTSSNNNITNIVNYNWQSSWFGNFYLPTNSSLIDAGSTTADQVGLYHYTTQTNQVPETNSIVDIGYHYVATDANGNPLDTNGDGIPDYLEDANGNGIVDNGEIPWNDFFNLKVLITQPRNGNSLP